MREKVTCPNCGARFTSKGEESRLRCPRCDKVFRAADRDAAEDDARPERGRRSRGRKRGSGIPVGLIVGVLVGGIVLLSIAGVLVAGFALGWFRRGPVPLAGPGPDGGGPGMPPIVLAPRQDGPNKELQDTHGKIFLESLAFEGVQKRLGPGREMSDADIDRLYDQVVFKKQVYQRFATYRGEMKVQRWVAWEREGTLLIVGLSRFRDGRLGISMKG